MVIWGLVASALISSFTKKWPYHLEKEAKKATAACGVGFIEYFLWKMLFLLAWTPGWSLLFLSQSLPSFWVVTELKKCNAILNLLGFVIAVDMF